MQTLKQGIQVYGTISLELESIFECRIIIWTIDNLLGQTLVFKLFIKIGIS